MSKADCTLSIDDLKQQVDYCVDTGVFTWALTRNRVTKGDIVGSKTSKGYLSTKIKGKQYKLHRLAWFYVYGVWPKNQIDHINGVRTDNRICNLRDVYPSQNSQNRSIAKKGSRTGLIGVSIDRGSRYRAVLQIDGVKHSIGSFDTAEEASNAYIAKKTELSKFFNAQRI